MIELKTWQLTIGRRGGRNTFQKTPKFLATLCLEVGTILRDWHREEGGNW